MQLNDIWSFLHDDGQQWYFRAEMNHTQAYVFDTLGEPHGSFILPGEDVAEQYYLQLQQMCEQRADGAFVPPPAPIAAQLPATTTAALRRAIDGMAELVACFAHDSAGAETVAAWQSRARQAMDAVVRKSLKMRVVALLLPDIWQFNRSRIT